MKMSKLEVPKIAFLNLGGGDDVKAKANVGKEVMGF